MKTLSLSDVKARLSGLVDEVERRDEEIVITRNGQPAAVLVSPDEYDSWKESLAVRSDKARLDLARQRLVRAHRERLLPAIVFVGADEERCRLAVARDDDFLVASLDLVH